MIKKFKEILNGLGMVVVAFAMMFAVIGLIFLFHAAFHIK